MRAVRARVAWRRARPPGPSLGLRIGPQALAPYVSFFFRIDAGGSSAGQPMTKLIESERVLVCPSPLLTRTVNVYLSFPSDIGPLITPEDDSV